MDVIGGTLIIDRTSTFTNTGTLETEGGTLIVNTELSGDLEIKGAAVLELGADSPATYSGAIVKFDDNSTGILKLDHSEAFGGKVVGLDDNSIDLLDIASGKDSIVTFDSKSDILTITNSVDPTQVAHIQLEGDYTGVTWSVTNDKNGGTSITEVPGVIAGLDSNGNATEGSPVKASITDGGAAVNATYTWQIFENGGWVVGSGVADANGNYTPGESDEGHALRVYISYVDALGNSESAIVLAGTVNGIADTPILHASASAGSTAENTATVLSGLSVQPGDGSSNDAADSFTATLYVEHGKLTLGSGLNATISGGDGHDAAEAVVITGSLADVNAALAAITYTPDSEYEGTDTVHFTALSTEEAAVGGNVSAPATPITATITVNGVADTPILHASASAGSTTENIATVLSGLSVQPGDGSSNDAADSYTATLYVEHGKLALGSGAFSVTASGDGHDSTHVLTITGTLADVNAALAAITYTPVSECEGTDTVHFTALSTEEAAVGGNVSAPATAIAATIAVNPIAEAGTAVAPATLTLNENASNVAITGVSVGPLAEDSDDTVSAALAVGHGTLHVDNTDLPAGVTVTGDDGGALTISGDAAAVNMLLKNLTYTPTTEFNGSDSLHLTVTSIDGSNASATKGTASTAITVKDGPNDLVATLDHTTAQQGVTMHVTEVKDGGITVSDGVSYKWQDANGDGTWKTVGTGSSYTPGESDEGKLMQLVVTYVDAGGSESSTYSLGMPNDLTVTVDSTNARPGATIHVTGVEDGGTNIPTSSNDLSYAWQRSSDNGNTWRLSASIRAIRPLRPMPATCCR